MASAAATRASWADPVEVLGPPPAEHLCRLEAGHLGGDADGKSAGVEVGDRAHSRTAWARRPPTSTRRSRPSGLTAPMPVTTTRRARRCRIIAQILRPAFRGSPGAPRAVVEHAPWSSSPGRASRYPGESAAYRLKRRLLGPPLVTEQLAGRTAEQTHRHGRPQLRLISSSAYGTEEMLTILVPYLSGLAAFTLVLPVTFAILGVLILVTLSYREVVMVYTKAGGSYVVARDNFGLNVAQFAAVALLIDYTVTVAVQVAAGTDALTSAVPSLGQGAGRQCPDRDLRRRRRAC